MDKTVDVNAIRKVVASTEIVMVSPPTPQDVHVFVIPTSEEVGIEFRFMLDLMEN